MNVMLQPNVFLNLLFKLKMNFSYSCAILNMLVYFVETNGKTLVFLLLPFPSLGFSYTVSTEWIYQKPKYCGC